MPPVRGPITSANSNAPTPDSASRSAKACTSSCRAQRLPINHTVTMTAADKRGVFIVPRGNVAYLGTTDTFYPDSDYWPTITADDVDYLLAAANRVFKHAAARNAAT